MLDMNIKRTLSLSDPIYVPVRHCEPFQPVEWMFICADNSACLIYASASVWEPGCRIIPLSHFDSQILHIFVNIVIHDCRYKVVSVRNSQISAHHFSTFITHHSIILLLWLTGTTIKLKHRLMLYVFKIDATFFCNGMTEVVFVIFSSWIM